MLKNFRALLAAALLAFAITPAAAQVVTNHALAVGRSPAIGLAAVPVGTDGQVPLGQTSGDPSFKTLSGDVSSVAAGGSVTLDSEIHCLAALTSAADKIAYYTGSGTCALADFPSAQRTYLTTPSSANLRGVLNDETGTGLAYFQGGALGTPSSGTLTNASGLPISGITGLGTGVGTALAVNVGSAGAPVLFNGALGTPSSGTLTSATGLPISTGVSGLGTGIATALGVNTGSAGAPVLFNGAGGTPSSLTLTNATGLPVSGITASTSTPLGVGSIELGHASDTTLSRSASGQLAVEGVDVLTTSNTKTVSNKTWASPVLTGTTDNQGTLKLSSFVTSTQITAAQNDYTATDGSNTCSTKGTLRLSSDASRNITGLSCGQAEGDVRILHNVGSNAIVLTNQDTGSTAANRFLFGGDMTLAADTSVTIRYDGVTSRWRAITTPGAGGGGGSGTVTSVAIAAGTGISTSGTCTITTSGTCTVSMADQYRQNDLLMCANQAKALAGYVRIIATFCDGYKASDGINSGSSSNYSVTTGSGYVGPTTSAGTTRFPTNMTGNSAPSPYVASSTTVFGSQSPYLVFDGNASTYWQTTSPGGTETLKIDLGSGNAVTVASYSLSSLASNGAVMIKTWTFEGSNDNSSWTTLDTQASQTGWGSAETRTFTLASTSAAYRYFRLQITAGNTASNYLIATFQATGPVTSNNMTLVTTTQTADTTVSNGRVLMEIDPIDSITLNTDLTAEVTCDSASHWASATLSSAGKGQAGRTVVESADTSCGANTGTGFAARIKNLNNKSVNVYKTTMTVH